MKIVYVTGCLGFIGGHITRRLLGMGWYVKGIDKCTYACDNRLLDEFNQYQNFSFEKKDINDLKFLYDCDYIINTAAETHVGNSIVNSEEFIRSNVMGVYNILELMRNYRSENGRTPTLVHTSTDEVYGDIGKGTHKETDYLKPSNPYCLHPDTKVLTANGLDVKISDLEVGTSLCSYNFETKTSELTRITDISFKKSNDLYEIKVSEILNPILCTGDHIFFIKRPQRSAVGRISKRGVSNFPLFEIKARDIKAGDWIATSREIFHNYGNSDLDYIASFLGFYAGNGYIKKSRNKKYNKVQRTILLASQHREFVEYYNSFLNRKGCVYKHKTKDCWYTQTGDGETIDLIYELGLGVKALDKIIPSQIMRSNLSVIAKYIGGLFDADGSCDKKRGKITICSFSAIVRRQLMFLLRKFGIVSSEYVRGKTVVISDHNSFLIFQERIKCLKQLNSPVLTPQNKMVDGGINYKTVSSVKKVDYNGIVYDLTVSNNQNFLLSNYIYTHNSSSKASADMLIAGWGRTYGLPYIIVRPTNNYGIGQYVEKLIPKAIKYLSFGRKVPLHNLGLPVRNWLHAEDTTSAIITLIEKGSLGEIYNVCGGFELNNNSVVNKICFLMGKKFEENVDYTLTRQGQDIRYSLNDEKIRALGWKPERDFDKELEGIVEYYHNRFIW